MATDISSQRSIEPQPGFSKIIRDDITYAKGNSASSADRVNGEFDRLMIQSGLGISPLVMLMLCLLAAISLGGIAFVIQENLMTAALGFLLGGMLPIIIAYIMRGRRQSAILRQMPGMVDELARAARTGRSLEHCFAMVADDTPSPLGDELMICNRKMQMGASISEAVRDLPARTGVVSLSVFATALSVHHQTGGDLIHVLERLASTIRDRLTFLGRLKTATTASRATALLMIILPPAILAFFVLRDPTYFEDLMSSTWGRNITLFAIVLQIIGSIWIIKILRSSQRN